jgi:Flp pilus assembly protein CpaB
MSGRRLIAILVGVVGLVILAVVVFLALSGNGGSEAEQAPQPEVADGATAVPGVTSTATVDPNIRMEEVVVSLQTVPRGWQMTEAELTTDMRPASDVTSNMVLRVEDAVGLYARHEIYQGETLTSESLSRDPTLQGTENYGPSSLVPPGWVAMAVPMDRLNSIAYGYLPGDTVDVMLSFTLNALDQEFQTLLSNSATFFLQQSVETDVGTSTTSNVFVIDPYGRFETLPTGDLAHIEPSDSVQRPVPVSVILQNARIVQVGEYYPPVPPIPPTPTPDPDEPTPTPGGGPAPTPTPPPPEVVLIALPPQQQLFLKYAVETTADIDFALRSTSDGQLYSVQQVDAAYLLEQFGIQVPPNSEFAIGGISSTSADAEELAAPEAEPGQ